MRYIEVVNWDRFQHPDVTRTERTPWIKLHTRLFDDHEFLELTEQQRLLLIGIWGLYAKTQRKVPESTAWLSSRLCQRVTKPMLEALNHAGFITFSASKLQADCLQAASVEEKREEPPVVPLQIEPPKPSAEDIVRVFENWREKTGHRRARLTDDRRRKIVARLKDYSVEELLLVPDGANADPWDDRKQHNDVGVLYRNAQQVDKFIALAQGGNGNGHSSDARELARRRLEQRAAL